MIPQQGRATPVMQQCGSEPMQKSPGRREDFFIFVIDYRLGGTAFNRSISRSDCDLPLIYQLRSENAQLRSEKGSVIAQVDQFNLRRLGRSCTAAARDCRRQFYEAEINTLSGRDGNKSVP